MEERAYTNKTLLVCGSRDWKDRKHLEAELDTFFKQRDVKAVEKEKWTIAHGGCKTGADQYAAEYGQARKIDVKVYPANWVKYGLAAGPIRNRRMVEEARPHAAIAFKQTATSKGTDDCLRRLQEYARLPGSRLWSIKIVTPSPPVQSRVP